MIRQYQLYTCPGISSPNRNGYKVKFPIVIFYITFIFLLLFPVCSTSAITVTDDRGYVITLKQPSSRIISLAPHTTELLFAAGAGNKIVGAVRYSYYPEQAKSIPRVGDTNNLDLERIISLEPDLIVAWQSNAMADTEMLRSLNIPIYVSEPESLEAVARSILALGKLSGSVDQAKLASEMFYSRLHRLKMKYSGRTIISTFYQFWYDPIFTINGDHIINDVMQLCGGKNIFAEMRVLSAQVSQEAVISANPEVIVASGIDESRPEWLDQWNEWPQIAAVKNRHIYYIPPDLIQRHTPRILDGAALMCEFIDKARTGNR